MLRASTEVLARLNKAKCGNSTFALEFVRWRRKPRWLPVAKSKMFRVPDRKIQPADEKAELMRLHNHYKTQLRSVRQFLRLDVQRAEETSTADHIVLTPEQEEAEFQRCMQINTDWNKQLAAEREARLTKQREERAAFIKERLELARIREEERLERINATVRKEKELFSTYITRQNLDAAIEQALANPIDYNFSIDLEGNIYCGRNTIHGGGGTPAATNQQDSGEINKLEATN